MDDTEHEVKQKTKSTEDNLDSGEAVALILSLMLSHVFISKIGTHVKDDAPMVSKIVEFILNPGEIFAKKINQTMTPGNEDGTAVWDEISYQWITKDTYAHMFSDPIVDEYVIAINTMHRESELIAYSPDMSADHN